jgi:lariat debranching enzyme
MHIAIEGCCHGELRKIYSSLKRIEANDGIKIDLLLICGGKSLSLSGTNNEKLNSFKLDFQSIRNAHDLSQISVPEKFKEFGDFYKYYSGEETAPMPTIFIGGNHEASNYLWELYHGGWVCPNIYYLGCCGVVNFAGLRIGGLKPIH